MSDVFQRITNAYKRWNTCQQWTNSHSFKTHHSGSDTGTRSARQGIHSLLWLPKVHRRAPSIPSLVPILSQFNPFHAHTSHTTQCTISSNLCSGTPGQITSVNRFRNFNLGNTRTAHDIRLYQTSGIRRDGAEVSVPLERYAALISIQVQTFQESPTFPSSRVKMDPQ